MKKLLLTCDQVFDVLTRGPFPTGDENDEHVEHHLRACHDCRQLAEALRPAVELLHEVVSEDQALDLPQYEGSLPDPAPAPPRLSVVRLAKPPLKQQPAIAQLNDRRAASRLRLFAASLMLIGICLWFAGLMAEQKNSPLLASVKSWLTATSTASDQIPDGIPSGAGLLSLASLKLPATCLPLTHRPLSEEHAAELALSLMDGSLEKLRCCTECHHAGQQPKAKEQDTAVEKKSKPTFAAVAAQNCQTCHRS